MSHDEVGNLISLHFDTVHAKIQRALDWSKKYKIDSSSETEDFRKIAALVLFHEMVSEESTMTGQTLCQEASANISDIAPWLRNNFHFPMKDVYTMLTTWMTSGANKLPFSPFGLNSRYEILQEAASIGDVDLIQWLLRNGVEVDTKDSDGRTALHVAAQEGHKELVRFLLENGASIFRMDNSNQTPFYKAFDSGHFDAADLLSPDLFVARNGHILITAAEEGSVEKVKYLLKYGSHSIHFDECIVRALTHASSKGYCAVVEAIIVLCPWYIKDCGFIDQLLNLAAKAGHARTVELLQSVGANIDQTTKDIALKNSSILRIFEKYDKNPYGSQIDVE